MNKLPKHILPVVLLLLPLVAWSDSDEDESGYGKRRGHDRREFQEEYWDGNCKVERKLEKSGEFKEERKCKRLRQGYYEHEQAVVVPAQPAIVVEPGVTIHGTVRIPQ